MPYRRLCPAVACPAVACLAALSGLTACDEGPATVTPYMHAGGALQFLTAATRNEGPLYLEIAGSPFTAAGDIEDGVAAVMAQAVQSRVLHLTTDQTAAEDPDFRLVLVFNPPDKGELLAFCARQPAGGPPQEAARIELRAGFCRGDDLIAGVDGWVEDASDPGDPKFEQLMRQVARNIFASRRPED